MKKGKKRLLVARPPGQGPLSPEEKNSIFWRIFDRKRGNRGVPEKDTVTEARAGSEHIRKETAGRQAS